jgi:hypothetical protein
MRPEPRQITAAGGFLKQTDVDKYFEILKQAKAKAGDSIYGKRIDLITAEMTPLKILFENLKRNGPMIQAYVADQNPKIDGDLDKPFWIAMPNSKYTFHSLRDMATGEYPKHINTSVSFRWLPDNSALVVGIKCMEPKMEKLREKCNMRDSASIYSDDTVEIHLETPNGIRPKIVVNPAGTILDECITANAADLPEFYTVNDVTVKKYPDCWTVEMKIDAKTISGERPTKTYPWGVNICRQRLAGNTPEFYMLSPSKTKKFKDMKSMGNLFLRK